MLHFIGKGPIWSVLQTEILRKIEEMVKKSKKKRFSSFWSVRPPETPLCWQNTEKVIPRLYSHSIVHGNKGPIWSNSVAAMYSESKVTQNKFLTLRKCGILVNDKSAIYNVDKVFIFI